MHAALIGAPLRCCASSRSVTAPPRLVAALDDFSARLRDDMAAGRLAASCRGYVAAGEAVVEAGLVLFDGDAADRDHCASASREHLGAVEAWAATLQR